MIWIIYLHSHYNQANTIKFISEHINFKFFRFILFLAPIDLCLLINISHYRSLLNIKVIFEVHVSFAYVIDLEMDSFACFSKLDLIMNIP